MVTIDALDGYRPRTYRRISWIGYGTGTVALVLGVLLGAPLVGFAVYALGFVVGFSVPHLAPRTVYDERDEDIASRANSLVLSALALGGLAVFMSLWVLEQLGRFTWSTELRSVFYAWSGFWLFYGATYTYVKHAG